MRRCSYCPGANHAFVILVMLAASALRLVAQSTGIVAVRNLDNVPRSKCVAISIGPAAASQCADLRIVHALPAVQTLGKVWAPTLIYNSATARLVRVAHADVTVPSGSLPSTVEVSVVVNGTQRGYKSYSGSDWGSGGSTRRVAVPFDITTPNCGWIHWVCDSATYVQATLNGLSGGPYRDSIVVAAVDRSGSFLGYGGPFGAGWWLDGLEQIMGINSTTTLWIGSDGSTRIYTTSNGVVSHAAALDYPDSLVYDSGAGTVVRRTRDGGKVTFSAATGRHISTTSRLGQVTRFVYVAGTERLDTIAIPVKSGTELKYRFVYDTNNVLSEVVAPGSRTVTMSRSGKRITGITDPDGKSVWFTYGSGTNANRIASRIDRGGAFSIFAFDSANHVVRSSRPLGTSFGHFLKANYGAAGGLDTAIVDAVFSGYPGETPFGAFLAANYGAAQSLDPDVVSSIYQSYTGPADAIVQALRPVESVGLATAVAVDSAYTLINGPRMDTTVTKIWVNQFGAPTIIRDAIGQQSLLTYDATWPGLVKEAEQPSGFVRKVVFGSAGRDSLAIGVNPLGDSKNDTTRYEWDPKWNRPTKVTTPTGVVNQFAYDTGNGNLLWQQRGTSSTTRDSMFYDGDKQLIAVSDPLGNRDSLFYDALGNLAKTRTALGFATEHFRDGVGRDTLTLTPIDAAQTLKQRRRTRYNVMDRVDSTVAIGPAMSYALQYVTPDTAAIKPDSAFTRHTYDAEGRPTMTKVSNSEIFFAEPGVVVTTESWEYDPAGRVRLHLRNGLSDSTYYDPAGNVIRVHTYGGGGYTQTFDSLNRVRQRVVAERTHAQEYCQGLQPSPETGPTYCLIVFPAYPNAANGALKIPADTARFTYDAAGNMIAADNGDARVHRRYFSNGALKVDSSWTRNANDTAFAHLMAIQYYYNASGQRDSVTVPTSSLSYPFSYAYSSVDGALTSVVDGYGTPYRYVYDVAGRVDSIVVNNGGVREKRLYDADHRQYARYRTSTAYTSNETFSFDAQGRIKTAKFETSANHGYGDSTRVAYAGLGAVLARERLMQSSSNWETEEFRVDGLGNTWRSRAASLEEPYGGMPKQTDFGSRGTLKGREAIDDPNAPQKFDSLAQSFDGDGNLVMSHQLVDNEAGTNIVNTPTRYYYAYDGKLRALQRHNMGRGVWEEYRYDALGRRVMVISRLDGPTPACEAEEGVCNSPCNVGDCSDKVMRQFWDGDQLLREERVAYPDNGVPNERFGNVYYVHGLELDHPLAVLDGRLSGSPRVLNRHWRGTFEASVTASGAAADCSIGSGSCATIPWSSPGPVYWQVPFGEPQDGVGITHTWSGSLLLDGRDGSGQMYRRNRYYDPTSGRFTQEDPIGLAGGMNLYGFGGGDPVNMRDPFGLSAEDVEVGCRKVEGAMGAVANHCAVRVGEGENKQATELLKDQKTGSNQIVALDPNDPRYTWTTVPVPAGMTQEQFDANALRSMKIVGKAFKGGEYSWHSSTNSNFFVFSVIKGAGGVIPNAAVPQTGRTPGLCGGGSGRLALGSLCSP